MIVLSGLGFLGFRFRVVRVWFRFMFLGLGLGLLGLRIRVVRVKAEGFEGLGLGLSGF